MTGDLTFALSRVTAEGWNAANRLSANESHDLNLWKVAALNPYKTEPERSRRSDGFAKALGA